MGKFKASGSNGPTVEKLGEVGPIASPRSKERGEGVIETR